ncbi:MAG: hypothetical protein AAF511_07390 [Pseudomonadota bacterium]
MAIIPAVLAVAFIWLSAWTRADEDQRFASAFLAAIFSEDDEAYRALVHPAMADCINRWWTTRIGSPPVDYTYTITEVTDETLSNLLASGRLVGVEDPWLPIPPTHQLMLNWAGEPKYFPGHPCFSEPRGLTTVTIALHDSQWGVVSLCLDEDDVKAVEAFRTIPQERLDKDRAAVDSAYASLSAAQRAEFRARLSEPAAIVITDYTKEMAGV